MDPLMEETDLMVTNKHEVDDRCGFKPIAKVGKIRITAIECLGQQNSIRIELSYTNVQLLVETLVEEIKTIVTEEQDFD